MNEAVQGTDWFFTFKYGQNRKKAAPMGQLTLYFVKDFSTRSIVTSFAVLALIVQLLESSKKYT